MVLCPPLCHRSKGKVLCLQNTTVNFNFSLSKGQQVYLFLNLEQAKGHTVSLSWFLYTLHDCILLSLSNVTIFLKKVTKILYFCVQKWWGCSGPPSAPKKWHAAMLYFLLHTSFHQEEIEKNEQNWRNNEEVKDKKWIKKQERWWKERELEGTG